MGVKQLTTWVTSRPDAFTRLAYRCTRDRHRLSTIDPWGSDAESDTDAGATSPLLIDGYSWLYRLMHADIGDGAGGLIYDALAMVVRDEMTALREAQFEPIVVLDGCRADVKYETMVQRKLKRIQQVDRAFLGLVATTTETQRHGMATTVSHPQGVLGLGVTNTVLAVLAEMAVRVITCDHEADHPLEREAQRTGATILSDDSDFLIASGARKGGCATMRAFHISNNYVELVIFSPDAIFAELGISPDMGPLLSALVGNDYHVVDIDVLVRLIVALWPNADHNTHSRVRTLSSASRVTVVAAFLAQFPSANAVISAMQGLHGDAKLVATVQQLFENNYSLQHDHYEMSADTTGLENSRTSLVRFDDEPIPLGLVQLFRDSQLTTELMGVYTTRCVYLSDIIEDPEQASAWLVSRPIRVKAYRIMLVGLMPQVREYLRKGRNPIVADLVTIPAWPELDEVALSVVMSSPVDIMRLPIATRRTLVLSPIAQTAPLSWPLQLLITAIRFLVVELATLSDTTARMFRWEAHAFACAITATTSMQNIVLPGAPAATRRSIHMFARFQTTLLSLSWLCSALGMPWIQTMPMPWNLICASKFYAMYNVCKRLRNAVDPHMASSYAQLLHELVTDGLDAHFAGAQIRPSRRIRTTRP